MRSQTLKFLALLTLLGLWIQACAPAGPMHGDISRKLTSPGLSSTGATNDRGLDYITAKQDGFLDQAKIAIPDTPQNRALSLSLTSVVQKTLDRSGNPIPNDLVQSVPPQILRFAI